MRLRTTGEILEKNFHLKLLQYKRRRLYRHHLCAKAASVAVHTGVTLVGELTEKNGGVGNETYTLPSALSTGESPKMRTCDLEPDIGQQPKSIRINETAKPSNRRRRRLRIYIPTLPLK